MANSSEDEAKRRHIGAYEIGRTLGEGAFGKVKLGTNIFTGEKVAVKIISSKNVKSEREKQQIQREREILLRLKHPNIVELIKVVDDEKRMKTYMIFEYVSGGELFDYIVAHGRLAERDARRFMRQMISAVEYCHSLLIVHRDLKPENLLLDKSLNIKISDFGLSNIMEPGKKFSTFCGSLHYACPEILRGETYLGPGVDIWSMGIVLYCLVVGRQPWDGANAEELIRGILEEGLEVPEGITDDCVNLILSMLRVAEADRISIAEMRFHPWILEGFEGPPESYLPKIEPVKTIDPELLSQLKQMGFVHDEDAAARELLSAATTQLTVTYNLLSAQKKVKSEKEIAEREARRLKKEHAKKEKEEQERKEREKKEREASNGSPRRNSLTTASLPTIAEKKPKKHGEGKESPRNSLGKKSNRSSRGEEGEKLRKSNSSKTSDSPSREKKAKAIPSIASVVKAESAGGRSRSRSIATSVAPTFSPIPAAPVPVAPTTPEVAGRSRATSVSNSPVRPTFSMEDIESGKLKAPTPIKDKKKSQFKEQQIAKKPPKEGIPRPSIVDASFFAPPRASEPTPPPPELAEADNAVTIAETTSKKSAIDILVEIKRVLGLLKVSYKEGKSPFALRCAQDIEGERVQLQIEVVNVKPFLYPVGSITLIGPTESNPSSLSEVKNANLRGVSVNRMSGDVWAYKKIYSSIIAELKL